jgi:proteasome lid subunit RPN8/RPN11
MQLMSPAILEAAERHARAEYPREACGLIVGDTYQPCRNEAADPEQEFAISTRVYLEAEATGDLRAVIHSHPDGPHAPSGADSRAQAASGMPWVILPLDAESAFHRTRPRPGNGSARTTPTGVVTAACARSQRPSGRASISRPDGVACRRRPASLCTRE